MPKSFRGSGKAGARNGGKHVGASSDNANRTVSAKAKASGAQLRSTGTINRLNMYRTKVKRDKGGKIVRGGLPVGQTVREMKPARVQPDRRWFGNTRVIGQKELTDFREKMAETQADPYAVVIKRHKLPMGLLADGNLKRGRVDLLRAQSYDATFGRKSQRKRPKLHGTMLLAHGTVAADGEAEAEAEGQGEWSELLAHVAATGDAYLEAADSNIEREVEKVRPACTCCTCTRACVRARACALCACGGLASRAPPAHRMVHRWGRATTSSMPASRAASAPSSSRYTVHACYATRTRTRMRTTRRGQARMATPHKL